jgi:hypothetical protein
MDVNHPVFVVVVRRGSCFGASEGTRVGRRVNRRSNPSPSWARRLVGDVGRSPFLNTAALHES